MATELVLAADFFPAVAVFPTAFRAAGRPAVTFFSAIFVFAAFLATDFFRVGAAAAAEAGLADADGAADAAPVPAPRN